MVSPGVVGQAVQRLIDKGTICVTGTGMGGQSNRGSVRNKGSGDSAPSRALDAN